MLCAFVVFCISSCKRNEFYTPDCLSVICDNGIADSLYGIEVEKGNNCYFNLYAYDSLLFLFSNNRDSLIHIYNMNDNSLLCKIGRIGHDKNEFVSEPNNGYCTSYKNKTVLVCADGRKHCSKVIDIVQSIISKKCVVIDEIANHENRGENDIAFVISDTKVIERNGVGYEDARDKLFCPPSFSIIEKGNDNTFTPYPQIVSSSEPAVVLNAYLDILALTPNNQFLIQTFLCHDLINIVDIERGRVYGITSEKECSFNQFNNMTFETMVKNLRIVNLDISVTNENIYLLRDGRKASVAEKDEGSSKINVLSLDGKFDKSFILDRRLVKFTVSTVKKCIWGVDDMGNLYKFDITDVTELQLPPEIPSIVALFKVFVSKLEENAQVCEV